MKVSLLPINISCLTGFEIDNWSLHRLRLHWPSVMQLSEYFPLNPFDKFVRDSHLNNKSVFLTRKFHYFSLIFLVWQVLKSIIDSLHQERYPPLLTWWPIIDVKTARFYGKYSNFGIRRVLSLFKVASYLSLTKGS